MNLKRSRGRWIQCSNMKHQIYHHHHQPIIAIRYKVPRWLDDVQHWLYKRPVQSRTKSQQNNQPAWVWDKWWNGWKGVYKGVNHQFTLLLSAGLLLQERGKSVQGSGEWWDVVSIVNFVCNATPLAKTPMYLRAWWQRQFTIASRLKSSRLCKKNSHLRLYSRGSLYII